MGFLIGIGLVWYGWYLISESKNNVGWLPVIIGGLFLLGAIAGDIGSGSGYDCTSLGNGAEWGSDC